MNPKDIDSMVLGVAVLAGALALVGPEGPYRSIMGLTLLVFLYGYGCGRQRDLGQRIAFSAVSGFGWIISLSFPLQYFYCYGDLTSKDNCIPIYIPFVVWLIVCILTFTFDLLCKKVHAPGTSDDAEIKDPNVENSWWILMQGLLYPAVLGADLFLLISKVPLYKSLNEARADISLYFGLLILCFFSISFLITHKSKNVYNLGTFFLDCIEIILIFFMFYCLGFLPNPLDPNPPKPNFWCFYFLLAIVPILQRTSRYIIEGSKNFEWRSSRNYLAVLAVLILLGGCFWESYFVWLNAVMIPVIATLIFLYYLILKKDKII